MVDAADLKSATFTGVWVRIPPPAPSATTYESDENFGGINGQARHGNREAMASLDGPPHRHPMRSNRLLPLARRHRNPHLHLPRRHVGLLHRPPPPRRIEAPADSPLNPDPQPADLCRAIVFPMKTSIHTHQPPLPTPPSVIPATPSVIPAQAGIHPHPLTLSLSKGRAASSSSPFPLQQLRHPRHTLRHSRHTLRHSRHTLRHSRAGGNPSYPFPLDGGRLGWG